MLPVSVMIYIIWNFALFVCDPCNLELIPVFAIDNECRELPVSVMIHLIQNFSSFCFQTTMSVGSSQVSARTADVKTRSARIDASVTTDSSSLTAETV